jgi:hypothetical protein
MLIKGMTPPEIRILQEFLRLAADSLPVATIKAIKHPVGGGEAPAFSLVEKGFLTTDQQTFALTSKAKDFLAYDPKPEFEEAAAGGETEEPVE